MVTYIHKPGTTGIKLQEEEAKTSEQQCAREPRILIDHLLLCLLEEAQTKVNHSAGSEIKQLFYIFGCLIQKYGLLHVCI